MTQEIELLAEALDLVQRCRERLRNVDGEGTSLALACDRFLARLDGWQRSELRCTIESLALGPAAGHLSLPSLGKDGNSTAAGPSAVDQQIVADAWNEIAILHGLPRVARIAGARAKALRARLADYGRDAIVAAIRKVPDSDFLCGRRRASGGWRASFDFLLRRMTVQKILEGNYDGGGQDTDHFDGTVRIA